MTHIRNINHAKTVREGQIRSFFHENKVSNKLASRVWHFIRRHEATVTRRTKENDIPILKLLPDPLRDELRQEVYSPILSIHPLFREYFRFDHAVVLPLCKSVHERE